MTSAPGSAFAAIIESLLHQLRGVDELSSHYHSDQLADPDLPDDKRKVIEAEIAKLEDAEIRIHNALTCLGYTPEPGSAFQLTPTLVPVLSAEQLEKDLDEALTLQAREWGAYWGAQTYDGNLHTDEVAESLRQLWMKRGDLAISAPTKE